MGKGGERNLEFMRLIVLTLRYLDRTAREFNGESVISVPLFFFLFTFTDYTDIVSLFELEITSIISGRWLSSVSPPPYACTGHVSVFCNPRNRTATRAEINIFVVRELEPRDIS